MALDLQLELRHLEQANRTLEQIAECIALIKRGANRQATLGLDNSSTLRVLETLQQSEMITSRIRNSILDRLDSAIATRTEDDLPSRRKKS